EGSLNLNGGIDALSSQFNFDAAMIRNAWATFSCLEGPAHNAAARLWEICRSHARPQLDDLAQRIEPRATWDQLVLPEAQKQVLREIAIHVRQRARVYEDWGFAAASTRGLGISALFSGPSGTGKTMAGEVLANELKLDL